MVIIKFPPGLVSKILPAVSSAFFKDLSKESLRLNSKHLKQIAITLKEVYSKLFHNNNKEV